jgi:Protein of unknown function (DUF1559)
VMVDTKAVSTQARKLLTGDGGEAQAMKALIALAPVMPLLEDTKLAGLAFTLGEGQGLRGYVLADDASAAERVADTLRALVTLGRNTLRQLRSSAAGQPAEQQAMMATFIPVAERLLETTQVKTEGAEVTLTSEGGDSAAIALGLILPAVQNAREAARRAQSLNNLKQIALAFHMYHDEHGHFPPAVIEENGVTRSWRVELLPYLGQQAIYDAYRKDQPWDSEQNKALLARIPPLYKDPSDPSERSSTSYFVLTGPHALPLEAGQAGAASTLFSDKPVGLKTGNGAKLPSIIDGTSNTLLVVEAKRSTPWTKPEDVPFDPAKAAELLQKEIGGNHANVFLAAAADGSARTISKTLDPQTLRSLITPAGGEPVGF